LLEALQAPSSAMASSPVQAAAPRAGLRQPAVSTGSWKIEIVASDIDTQVLETAVKAIYPVSSLEAITAPLQRKYFLRGKDDMEGKVKVKADVTRLIQFKNINLMDARWPLEDLFDVIFFRNALIYFNQDTQNTFLRKMARYLKPNGYLFLGNAEHIPWLADIFMPLNQTMYRLREVVR
jgi:chemotaxis protein methyltransferase CheR